MYSTIEHGKNATIIQLLGIKFVMYLYTIEL